VQDNSIAPYGLALLVSDVEVLDHLEDPASCGTCGVSLISKIVQPAAADGTCGLHKGAC